MKISCFILQAEESDLNQTIDALKASDLVQKITVLGNESSGTDVSIHWIASDGFSKTETLKNIANQAESEFTLIYNKSLPLQLGQYGLERMIRTAVDSGAGMVYSDYFELKEGKLNPHPVIEYQEGSLRDDFNFGSLILFKTDVLKNATDRMDVDYQFAGLYDLRLKVSQTHSLVHVPEFLYTEVELDTRKSGQKIFDYVDPKNRQVQIECELTCTSHLKVVGAYLEPRFRSIALSTGSFPVEASVIIPVRNRAKTIGDAIDSVLSQKTDFSFNLIIIDNHSTDGTTEVINGYTSDEECIIHFIPERQDLGIGGCWNEGIMHPECGKFAIQLDSDDLYIDDQVINRIVAAFYEQKCAMVVGSYQMVNFNLEALPPGLIDHKEWTPDNGRNNALRINGLGAPRAFYTPIIRDIKVPNTSYGEDYALGLNISRHYQIGRIYDPLYLCRRWEDNSDAFLDINKLNAHNSYKDWIRSIELKARQQYVKAGQPV
ncbi:glycosyltransferase family 2 protein [Bacteroidota bacterium]